MCPFTTHRHASVYHRKSHSHKPRCPKKYTIAKLTSSENYTSWTADLHIVLKHHQHWSWIEGMNELLPLKFIAKTDPDAANVDNPTYTIWEDGATNTLYKSY